MNEKYLKTKLELFEVTGEDKSIPTTFIESERVEHD